MSEVVTETVSKKLKLTNYSTTTQCEGKTEKKDQQQNIRNVTPTPQSITFQKSSSLELRDQYEKAINLWIRNTTEKTSLKNKETVKKILLTTYDTQSNELNLENLGLHSIPPLFGINHLKKVSLSRNNLTHVEFQDFSNMKNLKILNLNINKIKKIVDVDLSHHPSLKYLDLSINDILVIDNLNISHCPKFESLIMLLNPIVSIKNLNLSYCTNLKSFNLFFIRLEIIDNINLSNCPSLETIYLEKLKLERIGYFDLTNSNAITQISLFSNKLVEFPKWNLSKLIHLKNIMLADNNLSQIDENLLSILPKLRLLDISKNQFLELDPVILNLKTPQLLINVTENLFSPNTAADIMARQNMLTYQGPRFQLSIYDTIHTPNQLNELTNILIKWNHNPLNTLWIAIQLETVTNNIKAFMDLTIFLGRLYNETPREPNGTIPTTVQYHVKIILETLECLPIDKNLLDISCKIAKEYTETCGDKLAIGLIQLSLQCQKKRAKTEKNTIELDKINNALNWIDKTILFIRHINDFKVFYDEKKQTFQNLSEHTDELKQNEKMFIDTNQMTTTERSIIIAQKRTLGHQIPFLQIGDEVEDILMLLNKLKEEGLANIDAIDMKYRTCITLKNPEQQRAALNYLKNL